MKYGSRKFILATLSLFVNAGLLLAGAIDAPTYKAIVIATVAAYIVGNVAQKALPSKEPAA